MFTVLIVAAGFGASITGAVDLAERYGRHVARRLAAERVELAEIDAYFAQIRPVFTDQPAVAA